MAIHLSPDKKHSRQKKKYKKCKFCGYKMKDKTHLEPYIICPKCKNNIKENAKI